MRAAAVLPGTWVRCGCFAALGCLFAARAAFAFSAEDPLHPSVTSTFDQTAPTEADLRHQLQLQSGAFAAQEGGWTILPQFSVEEMFTDNILQTPSNRRWDFATIISPAVTILGDTPNVQLRLNYAPQARMAMRTPQENNISNQMLGTSTITVVPDLFYINANAFAGVGPTFGGFGTVGLGLSSQLNQPGLGSFGSAGLAKQNQTQYTSMSVTPYLMHRFGDYGTAKIGYQFSQSNSANNGSFLPIFFPTGNATQRLITNQEIAQFQTGDFFAPYRDLTLISATQGTGTGVSQNSYQNVVTNTLGYQITRSIQIYGQIGAENLHYGGTPSTNISDAVWGFGTTWTPNPDSQITIGYGHQNGVTGFQVNAYYALTARTSLSASYATGLQSSLQQLQGQLDLADLGRNGNAIDSQTGAPLFLGNNALGLQSGLYRSKTFTMTATTNLDRDQISLSLQLSQSTTVAQSSATTTPSVLNPPVGSTSTGNTGFLTWIHQFNEDLSLNSSVSYSTSKVPGTGNLNSIGVSTSLQYALSETLATFMRYGYFDQISSTPGQSVYQNLVLVGITKQF